MCRTKQKQTGVTLFETLLVLAIAASLILFGIKQYQVFRFDADVQALKANVDTIFVAMARYYRANCYGMINPAPNQLPYGQVTPGTLNPASTALSNFPIDIKNNLANNNFLISQLSTILPVNPLVSGSGPGLNGYVAQFNKYTSTREVCKTQATAGTPATGPFDNTTCSSVLTVATIIFWKPQIAVLLSDPAAATNATVAQNYLSLLAGDCLSNYNAGTKTVTPCNGSPSGTLNYVVWERLPSMASPNSQSGYWLANPISQQFMQMYNTYPTSFLAVPSQNGNLPNGNPQYIFCGS